MGQGFQSITGNLLEIVVVKIEDMKVIQTIKSLRSNAANSVLTQV